MVAMLADGGGGGHTANKPRKKETSLLL